MRANLCDGCGALVEEPEIFGAVIKRDYCPECAKHVRRYIEQRDALHDRLADVWYRRNAQLIEQLKKKVRAIPDEE